MKTDCPFCGEIQVPDDARFCPQCGRESLGEEIEAVLNFGQCPGCGSFQLRVYKTMRPWRYLKCMKCCRRWRTVEVWTHPVRFLEKAAGHLKLLGH